MNLSYIYTMAVFNALTLPARLLLGSVVSTPAKTGAEDTVPATRQEPGESDNYAYLLASGEWWSGAGEPGSCSETNVENQENSGNPEEIATETEIENIISEAVTETAIVIPGLPNPVIILG
jgi:hypothetical protein